MATLQRIRNKSGVLIAIIGVAMLAFVLTDLLNSSGSIMRGNRDIVGEVNGNEIRFKEFSASVGQLTDQGYPYGQAVNFAWNQFVRAQVMNGEMEELGLEVGEDELWERIITSPMIQNTPQFKNAAGVVDENLVKRFYTSMREQAGTPTGNQQWVQWLSMEQQIKENAKMASYNALINAGMYGTVLEGKRGYIEQNEQVNADYVYVPYSMLTDEPEVSDSEVESYIKAHANEFEREATRDIQYVSFEVKPSISDENEVRARVEALLKDKEVYNAETSSNETILGLANTTEDSLYVNQHSDVPFTGMYEHKLIDADLNEWAFSANTGDVYGPYKVGDNYAVSKLVDTKVMPDSVQASHILIAYQGTQGGTPSTRTEADAKELADSLLNVVKRNGSKFADLAGEFSDGPTATNGGDLGWFTYGRMVPEFNAFAFNGREGDYGVVKTVFGYHVINIKEQRNRGKAVKLATIVNRVIPSDETDTKIYNDAVTFAQKEQSVNEFVNSAKADGYEPRPVAGLQEMEYTVRGLGEQREIVRWAFDENTKIGQTKKFDVENGFVVAILTGSSEKGLASLEEARPTVAPKLRNEKKAEILIDKMKGSDLEAIATANETTTQSVSSLTFSNPIITGAGREPAVAGAMFGLNEGEVSEPIVGSNGVFVVKVTSKRDASELNNYETFQSRATSQYQSAAGFQVMNALQEKAEIEDNRARFY